MDDDRSLEIFPDEVEPAFNTSRLHHCVGSKSMRRVTIITRVLALACRCQEELLHCIYNIWRHKRAVISPVSLAAQILIASSPPVASLPSLCECTWTSLADSALEPGEPDP